jgi:hypothetical protein
MQFGKFVVSALTLALALALGGCGKKDDTGGEVIRIGSVAPLTGPQTHIGKDNENGARLAVDEINAKGLMLGARRSSWNCWAKMTRPSRRQPPSLRRSWSMPVWWR